MNRRSILKKTLSLIVIALLLSLRLGSFAEEIFTTPVEDALFHKVFIAEDNLLKGKLIKAKPNLAFEVTVDPPDLIVSVIEKVGQQDSPFVSDLILEDILSRIFIPPEVLS